MNATAENRIFISFLIILLLVIILLSCLSLIFPNNNFYERMINIKPLNGPVKWSKDKSCNSSLGKVVNDTLNSNNIKETNNNDYAVYFPCSYNFINHEIQKIKPTNPEQRFFIINNADQISSKNGIWKNLVSLYNREGAQKLMPSTYVLHDPQDRQLFQREFSSNKLYILKKNIQRQLGLKITRDYNDIVNAHNEGFVIVQELLQDPYLINGRKINMRFYLLIICQGGQVASYVHRNGFMYYTKEPFVKNSLKDTHNVTTGYIDRTVYETNPLTQEDFRKYLDNHNRKLYPEETDLLQNNLQISTEVFNRIYSLLLKVTLAVKNKICLDANLKDNITFQLFGADVSLSDTLVPHLMEINKGPDLATKDEKDSNIKHQVVNDVFKVIKVIPDEPRSEFIKLHDDY